MVGYVKRINDATLRVPIGGVRIGSAKYSRLAQINLNTRIITFSRYAIENVPERGRRYLVIHELSHVKEASHNKHFWQLVAEHEPRYKEIGKELEIAFHQNVRADRRRGPEGLIVQPKLFPPSSIDKDTWDTYGDSLSIYPDEYEELREREALIARGDPGLLYPLDSGIKDGSDFFECNDVELDSWQRFESGIVHGGSELGSDFDDDYLDH